MALFGKKEVESTTTTTVASLPVYLLGRSLAEHITEVSQIFGECSTTLPASLTAETRYVIVSFAEQELLNKSLSPVAELRSSLSSGFPQLIVAIRPEELTSFGEWLEENAEQISGLRPIVSRDNPDFLARLSSCRDPLIGPDVVQMPISPEIQNSPKKSFFSLSPASRRTISFIGELAENGITRVYLLGAPGAGKTSLAYYYFLKRATGNFVTVNLNAESTGDKTSMKSLICGHVAGSTPGAQTREGALSFARDGVCFLDESHGTTGVVMQILMEVLENSQFLPFGATVKRPLECAVLFASNRSWEALQKMMHIDEHARLGATIVEVSDLRVRSEDLIAVCATTLSRIKSKFSSWNAPTGLSSEAWRELTDCSWRGNVRSLMRVIESASVSAARANSPLIELSQLKPALDLWEPEEISDSVTYASFG